MKELILYPYCPLCESKDFSIVMYGECSNHKRYDNRLSSIINWCECKNCGHNFRDGYYTDDALQIVFQGTNENQIVGFDIENQRNISSRMIDKVLPYQNNGIWMDVGFGNGSLLFTAHEYGFKPFGLDLRKSSVDNLKTLGIDAVCCDLTKLDFNEPIAVISLCDVLEHVPYPDLILRKCHQLLMPNGVLFLSMPNTESMIWIAMNQSNSNPYWGEIEHYHNFSRTRLYRLLEEHGFSVVKYGVSERYRACMEVVALKK